MKKLIVITLSTITLLSACNTEEQEVSSDDYVTGDVETYESETVENTEDEKEKTDVINNLPDFTISLPTFIEEYNIICEGEDGFPPIEKEFVDIELVEESGNYYADLIDVNTNTFNNSLTAMFDEDKKFKRLSYVHMTKGGEDSGVDAINDLLGIFYALDIESPVIVNITTDILNYESEGMKISTEKYEINSTKIGDGGTLIVAIDGKE